MLEARGDKKRSKVARDWASDYQRVFKRQSDNIDSNCPLQVLYCMRSVLYRSPVENWRKLPRFPLGSCLPCKERHFIVSEVSSIATRGLGIRAGWQLRNCYTSFRTLIYRRKKRKRCKWPNEFCSFRIRPLWRENITGSVNISTEYRQESKQNWIIHPFPSTSEVSGDLEVEVNHRWRRLNI